MQRLESPKIEEGTGHGRNDRNHQTKGNIGRGRHDLKHLKQKKRWDAVSMTEIT